MMKTCRECGCEVAEIRKERFRYAESGLDNVFLDGVVAYKCTGCGRNNVVVPAVKELHFLIIINLIFKQGELTPAEVAYLDRMVRERCWCMVNRPFEGIYSSGPMVFRWTGESWESF